MTVLGVLAILGVFFFLLIYLPLTLIRTLLGIPAKPRQSFFRFNMPGGRQFGSFHRQPPKQSEDQDVIDIKAEVINTTPRPPEVTEPDSQH